jgi:hypothetical protein
VHRAPAALAPLRDAAAAAGFAWHDIDLGAAGDKAALLKALAAALAFPATFGANWDALADCLQDLSWRRERGHVIHLANGGTYARTAPADWAIALEILGESATYWKTRGRAFIVLASGAAEQAEFKW